MRRPMTNIGAHTSVVGVPNGGAGQTGIGEGPTGIGKTTKVGGVNRDRSRDKVIDRS